MPRYAHPRLIAQLLWPIKEVPAWLLFVQPAGLKVFINYVRGGRPEMAPGAPPRLIGSISFPSVWVKVPRHPGNGVNKAPFGNSNSGPKVTAFLSAGAELLCNSGLHLLRVVCT